MQSVSQPAANAPAAARAEQRAQPPAIPTPTLALLQARAEADAHRRQREALERRSLVRAMLLLAAIVLFLSIARAGFDRAFVPGWWRQW
jgi:hypothetical protein